MTWLSFTLYGIWIPVRFNIHFCIQECKYDKMDWRRRRVGKTKQLIRFISFILILASVKCNNHIADVMSTSFADKLCLHISTTTAYMTGFSLSGSCVVFSSESETNPHMTMAVLMFLGSEESVYRCVTNGVTRSCAILIKKSFLLSSSQANLCACRVHIWPMHLPQ